MEEIKARVNTNLNIRTGLPDVNAPNDDYYREGDEVVIVDIVNGSPYEGNKVWYKLDNGKYVWSGGVEGIKDFKSVTEELVEYSDLWWLKDYNIPDLWQLGLTGKDIRVAVLDSGLSLPHDGLIINKEYCEDKSLSKKHGINDIIGHGTHCTGIIKAIDKGAGVKGIASDCELYFCKIRGDEFGDSLHRLKAGIEWAISKNVNIISISIGKTKESVDLQPIFDQAIKKKIIPICSGGNFIKNITQIDDILYPAKYSECISVGSVDKYLNPSKGTLISKNLTIGAPGTEIKSTYLNNTYTKMTGTSQAAPFVAGVVALILQYCNDNNINYSFSDIKKWLIQTSDKGKNTPFPVINPIKLINKLKI